MKNGKVVQSEEQGSKGVQFSPDEAVIGYSCSQNGDSSSPLAKKLCRFSPLPGDHHRTSGILRRILPHSHVSVRSPCRGDLSPSRFVLKRRYII